MLKWENELRQRPCGADDAEGGEGDVPHDEEAAHLVPRPRLHVPLHEHDHGQVGRCNQRETVQSILQGVLFYVNTYDYFFMSRLLTSYWGYD